eukprot:gene6280-2680_t
MPPDADLRGLNLSACDFSEVLRKREKKKGDVVVRGGKRCTVTRVKGDGDVEIEGAEHMQLFCVDTAGADFRKGVRLGGSSLRAANFAGADLSGGVVADAGALRSADFSGAKAVSFASALDLRCGDFGGYRFDRFDLTA